MGDKDKSRKGFIMIKSMTGYGRGECQDENKFSWVVEMRSVNHRFLDTFIRLPKPWLMLEDKIKSYIKGKIIRGRIDVFISQSHDSFPVDIKIDKTMATNYYEKLMELKEEVGFDGPISLSLLSLVPDIFSLEEEVPKEQELWDTLQPALEEALKNLVAMRAIEGQNLWKDVSMRLDAIKANVDTINDRAETVPGEYRERLMEHVKKLSSEIYLDKERLETEVVLFAEKSSITEELVRLKSHIAQMEELVDERDSVGKKMDFIVQEMLREANTIASKSSDYKISKEVIDIKSQIEKIREQTQNIE